MWLAGDKIYLCRACPQVTYFLQLDSIPYFSPLSNNTIKLLSMDESIDEVGVLMIQSHPQIPMSEDCCIWGQASNTGVSGEHLC